MSNDIKCASSGFLAGGLQTGCLIWLRTINKYQYYHGLPLHTSVKNLYKEENIRRFFRGITPAMLDNSMCRFGDAYIYSHIKRKYNDFTIFKQSMLIAVLNTPHKISLTPLDTIANNYHVFGKNGKNEIKSKIKKNGAKVLFNGGGTIMFLNIISSFSLVYYITLSRKENRISL